MLNREKTVFETIDDIAQGDIRPKIRNILGSFLFSDDDIDKKVKVLSGGEKARLALAKLLLTPSNLLVLDEPTNHLDMNSKDILKNALLQYSGTLIVVSHDRDFLSGLTDELYEFRDGAVHEFKGDIMEFLEAQNAQETQSNQAVQNAPKAPTAGKAAYEQSKERERERRKLQNVVKQKEQEIEALEAEIAERDKVLATGAAQTPEFYKEYQSLKAQLEQKMEEWEEAIIAAEE
jgi:ATP-binding cassette subfamily F protein 3